MPFPPKFGNRTEPIRDAARNGKKAIPWMARRSKLCIQAEGAVRNGRKLAEEDIADMDIQNQSEEAPDATDGRDERMKD